MKLYIFLIFSQLIFQNVWGSERPPKSVLIKAYVDAYAKSIYKAANKYNKERKDLTKILANLPKKEQDRFKEFFVVNGFTELPPIKKSGPKFVIDFSGHKMSFTLLSSFQNYIYFGKHKYQLKGKNKDEVFYNFKSFLKEKMKASYFKSFSLIQEAHAEDTILDNMLYYALVAITKVYNLFPHKKRLFLQYRDVKDKVEVLLLKCQTNSPQSGKLEEIKELAQFLEQVTSEGKLELEKHFYANVAKLKGPQYKELAEIDPVNCEEFYMNFQKEMTDFEYYDYVTIPAIAHREGLMDKICRTHQQLKQCLQAYYNKTINTDIARNRNEKKDIEIQVIQKNGAAKDEGK